MREFEKVISKKIPSQVEYYPLLNRDIFLFKLFKSPQSGVTLCFQFVSVAAAAVAEETLASHVETV